MFFWKSALAAGLLVLAIGLVVSTASAAPRDRTPPTTPTNLRVIGSTGTLVRLAWNASTDNSGNFSYHVTQSSVFNTYTVGVPQTRTTLTFTGLWPETTYTYTVYAVDAAGNRSGNSNPVSYTAPPDVRPPTPAPQLTVNYLRSARVGLSWTRSVDNVSPVVKYTLYADGIQQVELFGYEHHTLWHLTPSTTYEFQVTAQDSFGNAVEGSPITVTTPASTDTMPPTAPTNLALGFQSSEGEAWLNWSQSTDNSDPQGEILYDVYVGGELTDDGVLGGGATVAYCRGHDGPTPFVVRAVDTSGNVSLPSNEIVFDC